MRALSQRVHIRRARSGEYLPRRDTPPRTARPRTPGSLCLRDEGLPADALAELHGLALLLAPVQDGLEPRRERDEQREEHHHAEREEGDDLVVRLSIQTLAVVTREGGGGGDQPGRENEDGSELPHAKVTIPCRLAWPIPSTASSRPRSAAATSTSATTRPDRSSSTGSSSRRWCTRPTTASFRTRSRSTATPWM